jgi:hypothetical protein
MHEVIHTLGLCGEKHVSFLAILLEYPTYMPIFNYIKTILK